MTECIEEATSAQLEALKNISKFLDEINKGCPDLWGEENNKIVEGVKNDTGKPRLDLIPSEAIMALGEVLHFGAAVEGYNERNWEKGMDWGRVYGALQRHLWKWWAGIETDDKSGLSHLSHAIANLAFLIAYSKRGIGKDTRK